MEVGFQAQEFRSDPVRKLLRSGTWLAEAIYELQDPELNYLWMRTDLLHTHAEHRMDVLAWIHWRDHQ